MLGVYRTVIKLSTVHSSITRYTNMLHNETESVHPILWCAYICRAIVRLWRASHRLKGVRHRENTVKKRMRQQTTPGSIMTMFGHTSSVSCVVLSCRGSGGQRWLVHLSVGLHRLHCLYQAAAGQHHVPGRHVFGLQLPHALLTVPDAIAKIHKETWEIQ